MLFFPFLPFFFLLFWEVPIYEAYRAVFAARRLRFSARRFKEFLVLVAFDMIFPTASPERSAFESEEFLDNPYELH